MTLVYKIVAAPEWRAAEAGGVFRGAAIDLADGCTFSVALSRVAPLAFSSDFDPCGISLTCSIQLRDQIHK